MFDKIKKRYHNIENDIIIYKTKTIGLEYFHSVFIFMCEYVLTALLEPKQCIGAAKTFVEFRRDAA